MSQMIQIQGGLVTVIDQTIRTQLPLDEWLPRIESRAPLYMPVLPSGTRAVWWDPTDLDAQTLMIMMEVEPKTIQMNLVGVVSTLSLPYTRFIFIAKSNAPTIHTSWRLTDYRAFMSNRRYSDPDTEDMVAALLPNVYQDARICFGSTGANSNQTLADRLDDTVNNFFASTFNRDLTIRRPQTLRTYSAWRAMTRTDPTAWANWPDFDPQQTQWELTSWNYWQNQLLANNATRHATVIAADNIPELPLGATFGRAREWLNTLTTRQFDRLRATINEPDMLSTFRLDDEQFEEEPDEATL